MYTKAAVKLEIYAINVSKQCIIYMTKNVHLVAQGEKSAATKVHYVGYESVKKPHRSCLLYTSPSPRD